MIGGELPRGLKRAVIGSLVAHLALGLIVVAVSAGASRAKKPRERVLVTQLVRLGKERPEHLLPRKEAPPPPKEDPPPVKPKVEPPPAPKPEPKPAVDPKPAPPSAKERLSQLSQVASALDRLKQQAEEEGSPDGSQYGTVKSALLGAKFASEVHACMKAHYSLEGLTPAQTAGRKAIVLVRIDADGKIRDAQLETSSGLGRFDQNVVRAALRCGKVSPPPKEMLEDVREGVLVEFTP